MSGDNCSVPQSAGLATYDTETGLMGNCQDCLVWKERTTRLGTRFGVCDITELDDPESAIGDSDMAIFAVVHDDSGLYVGLKTGPMFGCVKFQARASRATGGD
jgi:hypothetical protein